MNCVVVLVDGRSTAFGFLAQIAAKKRKRNVRNKLFPVLLVLILCSSSCISVGMNDETKDRVDKALAEVDKVSKILEEYHKDFQALTERLDRLLDRFLPAEKKPTEKKPEDKNNSSP